MENFKERELVVSPRASTNQALQTEIGQRNFVRAVMIAQGDKRPQEEISHLQELALKQMACKYRNAIALSKLAKEWGFSRADLESILMKAVVDYESGPEKRYSGECYDVTSGKYLTLRQWVKQLLNKL